MPYKPDGTSQRNSGLPGVLDIYYSANVFINNVNAALWNTSGISSAFAIDIEVGSVELNAEQDLVVDEIDLRNDQYEGDPEAFSMPADVVEQNAIEPQYQGAQLDLNSSISTGTSTGVITTASYVKGIVPWLKERLDEAKRGMWNRTYQTSGVSNPNIVNIWKAIGLGSQFTTDTTPWCAGFVNFALKQNGYRWCSEPSARAIQVNPRRWYATTVTSITAGAPGDIALWNYNGQYHVNFVYEVVAPGVYTFVGGNQSSKEVTNNNPSKSTVSKSWPYGWSEIKNKPGSQLVGLWRPSTATTST